MKHSAAEIKILNKEKNKRNKKKEGTSNPSPKKGYFVKKNNRTSRATKNTDNSNINVEKFM